MYLPLGALLFSALSPSVAWAVPDTLFHQGRVFDASGQALEGEHLLTFSIYLPSDPLQSVWSEQQTLSLLGGHFEAVLGLVSPLVDVISAHDLLSLGVSVDEQAELPLRTSLNTAPFALRASTVNGPADIDRLIVQGVSLLDADGALPFSSLQDLPWMLEEGDILARMGCLEGEVALFAPSGWTCVAFAHQHTAEAFTSGTFSVDRLPVGVGSQRVARGDHGHDLAGLTGVLPVAGLPVQINETLTQLIEAEPLSLPVGSQIGSVDPLVDASCGAGQVLVKAGVSWACQDETAHAHSWTLDRVLVNGVELINAAGQWLGPPVEAPGAQGPNGIVGATGATGDQGPTGDVGVQGAKGATGDQGISGSKGPKGTNALSSQVGPSGSQGVTGDRGPAGFTGATGARGSVGLTGAQGLTGFTGAQGVSPTGATGARGALGLTGLQGLTGLTGLQGLTGLAGPTGATGSTGAQGPSGPLYGCMLRSSCPSGWASYGYVGVIRLNGSSTCPGAPGAAFDANWTWCHPLLCCK